MVKWSQAPVCVCAKVRARAHLRQSYERHQSRKLCERACFIDSFGLEFRWDFMDYGLSQESLIGLQNSTTVRNSIREEKNRNERDIWRESVQLTTMTYATWSNETNEKQTR